MVDVGARLGWNTARGVIRIFEIASVAASVFDTLRGVSSVVRTIDQRFDTFRECALHDAPHSSPGGERVQKRRQR